MGFNDLAAKTTTVSMTRFKNCDVIVKLNGVTVKSIPGIFDRSNQVVSPFESDRLEVKPSVVIMTDDLANVTSASALEINGVEYKLDGKPQSDGHGLTTIHLGTKK